MRRRDLIAALGSSAAWPIQGRAQGGRPLPRIGFLATRLSTSGVDAFRQGLRELGYVEGSNIVIETRDAEGRLERFPALASELVRFPVDIVVATNSLAGHSARQASGTIPIVVPLMGDPVGDGLVASLARPGGNVTGLTFLGPELLPKRVTLLKDAIPGLSRVTALWHPEAYGRPTMTEMLRGAQAAADGLGISLPLVAVEKPADFERAFSEIAFAHAEAVVVFPSPMLFSERERIVALLSEHRLPSIAMSREYAELGGLMTYGASLSELQRRSARYVDRILKGAKPADLPVEQPTIFELVVNLRTARTLGISIPPSFLARADEVIE